MMLSLRGATSNNIDTFRRLRRELTVTEITVYTREKLNISTARVNTWHIYNRNTHKIKHGYGSKTRSEISSARTNKE